MLLNIITLLEEMWKCKRDIDDIKQSLAAGWHCGLDACADSAL
jgi:hypothetical protein